MEYTVHHTYYYYVVLIHSKYTLLCKIMPSSFLPAGRRYLTSQHHPLITHFVMHVITIELYITTHYSFPRWTTTTCQDHSGPTRGSSWSDFGVFLTDGSTCHYYFFEYFFSHFW